MKAADLALSGLTKRYGSAKAVDGVTLRIAAGELVALLGPSGCGKTTTLRMIAGLVEPSEGEILIDGYRVTHVPVHRRNIGMLFQNYALFPHLTIADNVAFGLEMRGVRKSEVRERVTSALRLVQLDQLSGRYPAALSGGQQQRAALARAFVINPSLLLLDEPLSALDKNLREDMQIEIRQIQRNVGITAVLVTHDQEEAMTMADHIVVMRGGKLEQMGRPADIYQRPVSRFVASFIGASNFLEGLVVGNEGDESLVKVEGIAHLRVPGKRAAGEKCLVSLRPEAIGLSPLSAQVLSEENALTGIIEQIIYRGQTTLIHLRLDNGENFVTYLPSNSSSGLTFDAAHGDRVRASWKTESNHVIIDN